MSAVVQSQETVLVVEDEVLGLLQAADQAVALTGMAYLDHALETLLKTYFRILNTDEYRRLIRRSSQWYFRNHIGEN
jgi:hypothetical protein